MNKYVKVMFGSKSGANKNINYKIDEVNIADTWNPNTFDPKEMGGFNFSTYDKVFRWLIRGDTIYDVEIPNDAEIINLVLANIIKSLIFQRLVIQEGICRLSNRSNRFRLR